jgi:predicted protein tyrosine phosphatase
MKNPIRFAKKGYTILSRRIRDHGLKTTLIWVYGRGLSKLTGVPVLRHSRVTPQLYVGPQYNARGLALLQTHGITHGVNLRIEFDDEANQLALPQYCYLPTVDDDAPTLEHLQQGIDFIHQAINDGGKVYIHCAGGVGRAPTMAAAYLMSTGLSLDESLEKIRQVRPYIYIMPVQMEQLRKLEAQKGRV